MLKQHAGWMCFSVRGPHTTVMDNEGKKILFFFFFLLDSNQAVQQNFGLNILKGFAEF